MIKSMEITTDNSITEPYLCKTVCDMAERGDIRDDFWSQRTKDQWSKEDRDNFIVTMLLNEKFDSLKLCEEYTPHGVALWLIDGLQKYTYIVDYKAGGFKLSSQIEPEEIIYQEVKRDADGKIEKDMYGNTIYEKVKFSLKNKSYSDLPKTLQDRFDNCPVMVTKHLNCTREEMARHLRRYNRGSKMKPGQILLTRMVKVCGYIRDLTEHPFWSDKANYTPTLYKNGKINQIVSELVMIINFFDAWTKNAQKMGAYLEEHATDEMFEYVENILDQLMEVTELEIAENLFTQKNALVWVKFFDECINNGISKEVYGMFLNEFDKYSSAEVIVSHEYEIVKGSGRSTNKISWNGLDACKSTKDKGILEDKLHILHNLMEKFIEDNGFKIKNNTDETENINEEPSDVIEELETVENSESNNNEEIETKNTVESTENTTDEDELVDFATDSTDDPMESIPNDELVEFVKENTELDVDSEDIALYKDMLEGIVPITSQLYLKCYKALIALMAEACDEDKDNEFADWVQNHKYDSDKFSTSQRVNYLYFKRDFDKAVAGVC